MSTIKGSSLRIGGLHSGLDTEAIVNAMSASTKLRITSNQRKVLKLEAQQNAYRSIIDKFNNIKNKYFDILNRNTFLGSRSTFNKHKATVSKNGVEAKLPGINVTTNSDAIAGSYRVSVVSHATQATIKADSIDGKANLNIDEIIANPTKEYTMRVTVGGASHIINFKGGVDEDEVIANINAELLDKFGKSNTGSGLVFVRDVSTGATKELQFVSTEKKPISTGAVTDLSAYKNLDITDIQTGNNSIIIMIDGVARTVNFQTVDKDYFKNLEFVRDPDGKWSIELVSGLNDEDKAKAEEARDVLNGIVKDMHEKERLAAYEAWQADPLYRKDFKSIGFDSDERVNTLKGIPGLDTTALDAALALIDRNDYKKFPIGEPGDRAYEAARITAINEYIRSLGSSAVLGAFSGLNTNAADFDKMTDAQKMANIHRQITALGRNADERAAALNNTALNDILADIKRTDFANGNAGDTAFENAKMKAITDFVNKTAADERAKATNAINSAHLDKILNGPDGMSAEQRALFEAEVIRRNDETWKNAYDNVLQAAWRDFDAWQRAQGVNPTIVTRDFDATKPVSATNVRTMIDNPHYINFEDWRTHILKMPADPPNASGDPTSWKDWLPLNANAMAANYEDYHENILKPRIQAELTAAQDPTNPDRPINPGTNPPAFDWSGTNADGSVRNISDPCPVTRGEFEEYQKALAKYNEDKTKWDAQVARERIIQERLDRVNDPTFLANFKTLPQTAPTGATGNRRFDFNTLAKRFDDAYNSVMNHGRYETDADKLTFLRGLYSEGQAYNYQYDNGDGTVGGVVARSLNDFMGVLQGRMDETTGVYANFDMESFAHYFNVSEINRTLGNTTFPDGVKINIEWDVDKFTHKITSTHDGNAGTIGFKITAVRNETVEQTMFMNALRDAFKDHLKNVVNAGLTEDDPGFVANTNEAFNDWLTAEGLGKGILKELRDDPTKTQVLEDFWSQNALDPKMKEAFEKFKEPIDFAMWRNTDIPNHAGNFGNITVSKTTANTISTSTRLSELGVEPVNGRYNIEINGTTLTFDGNTTINQMMNAINSNAAMKVNMTFSTLTNTFEIKSKEFGTGASVTLGGLDKDGNLKDGSLLTALGFTAGNTTIGAPQFNPNITTNPNITSGKNMEISVNDLVVEVESNSYEINGLVITVSDTAALGEEFLIEVERDNTQIADTIREFVKDYNDLIDFVYGFVTEKPDKDYYFLTDSDREELGMTESQEKKWEEKAMQGLLYNDRTITGIMSRLRTVLYSGVSRGDGTMFGLFSMGITTSSIWQQNGKLVIDEDKFMRAITEDADMITDLFTNLENGIMPQFQEVIESAVKTTGSRWEKGLLVQKAGMANTTSATDNSIFDHIKRLNDVIGNLELRYQKQQDRYWKIFSALEKQMAQFNGQSDYLGQMLGSNMWGGNRK